MSDPRRRYLGGLAADDHGTADDRPPLLLLHGLTYDRRQWASLLEELARVDPGRRAVAVDLPGHGESALRDSYGLDEIAEAVHGAAKEAGLDAPVVVGHSLGGVLATAYAARYPARGVINVDQPLLPGPFAERLREAEPVLRGPGWMRVWDSMLAGMHVDLLPPAARRLVRTATTPRQDLLLGYWHEILTRPAEELAARRAEELRTIHRAGIPYHYVTGTQPVPRYREWLESLVPGVAVTVLPGSGHFPHLAQPAAFARIVAGTAG